MKNRYLLFLSLITLPLLLNGCMTMGWSGADHNRSRTGTQNQILVKERQVEDYTLTAEFPSSVVGEEVRFAFEIEGGEVSKGSRFEPISLQINKQNGNTVENTFTKLYPDRSLSTATRFVFPYRFDETGIFQVTFTLNDSLAEEVESPYTISANLSVSESYDDYTRSFNTTVWIVGGSAVMVGMMMWMIAD